MGPHKKQNQPNQPEPYIKIHINILIIKNAMLLFQASCPAATELETIVMDWLGKMIGLPVDFLHSNEQTRGGGVIQVSH